MFLRHSVQYLVTPLVMMSAYLVGHGLEKARSVAESLSRKTDAFAVRMSFPAGHTGRRATHAYHVILHTQQTHVAAAATTVLKHPRRQWCHMANAILLNKSTEVESKNILVCCR